MATVSGVKCHQDVIDKYNVYKKKDGNIAYIVCKIEDGVIVIEEAPTCSASEKEEKDEKGIPTLYKQMYDTLIKGGTRYAFYTYDWDTTGGPRSVIILIQYCDDNCHPKHKLHYSTSISAIKKPCTGVHMVVEANDKDEISYHEILEKCKKSKR